MTKINNSIPTLPNNGSAMIMSSIDIPFITSSTTEISIVDAGNCIAQHGAIYDWILRIERVFRNEITGWVCSHGDSSQLTLLGCDGVDFSIEWSPRKDVAESYSGYSCAAQFKIKFARSLYYSELQNLSVILKGNGACVSKYPIFCIYNGAFGLEDMGEVAFMVSHSKFFDTNYYLNQANLPHDSSFEYALRDYLNRGWLINLNPHPLFSTSYYLKVNKDVAEAGVNPLFHYLSSGCQEDRVTSPEFNSFFYRSRYGRSIPAGVPALYHYLEVGISKNYTPVDWLDEEAVCRIQLLAPNEFPQIFYKKHLHHSIQPNSALEGLSNYDLKKKGSSIKATKAEGGLDIIIPFYKEPHLMSMQQKGLLAIADEIKDLGARVILILDSPDDRSASECFDKMAEALQGTFETKVIRNTENIGFINSTNRGLEDCLAEGRNALLLNSDCILTPGCLSELISVSNLDPLIGFVCPRSNNATICTYPGFSGTWKEQYGYYSDVKDLLPRISYVPTAVGFCLLITRNILRDFGVLDATYGMGYNEENDLIMRANRYGYRAALANHAYAFHMGQQSFATTDYSDELTARTLQSRYPEYNDSIVRYHRSLNKYYEDTLAGSVSRNGRRRVLLDASAIGPHKNGTTEFVRKFTCALLEEDHPFEISLLASNSATEAHGLANLPGLNLRTEWPDPRDPNNRFAAVLRMSQPFERQPIINAIRVGYAYLSFMLDPIVYDCQYLNNDKVQEAWELLYHVADGMIYQSKFTARLFSTRFETMRNIPSLVSYHSLDPVEYAFPNFGESQSKSLGEMKAWLGERQYIFVVGNHFAHKDVQRAYALLAAHFPRMPIVVLGHREMAPANWHPFSRFLHAGDVEDDLIKHLYENAEAIVFPSHYEGFGFPLLNAAHFGRNIVLRDTEVARELGARLAEAVSATYFSNIGDLPAAVQSALKKQKIVTRGKNIPLHRWKDSAKEVADFINGLIHQDRKEIVATRHNILRAICGSESK